MLTQYTSTRRQAPNGFPESMLWAQESSNEEPLGLFFAWNHQLLKETCWVHNLQPREKRQWLRAKWEGVAGGRGSSHGKQPLGYYTWSLPFCREGSCWDSPLGYPSLEAYCADGGWSNPTAHIPPSRWHCFMKKFSVGVRWDYCSQLFSTPFPSLRGFSFCISFQWLL